MILTLLRRVLLLIAATTAVFAFVPAHGEGATTMIDLASVGDSITYEGATVEGGWVELLASDLGAKLNADTNIEDLGFPGYTSGEVLAVVDTDQATRLALSHAAYVTYQAGTNDFLQARGQYLAGSCGGIDNEDCLRATVSAFESNWDRLGSALRAVAPHAALRTMDIYYPTVAYDSYLGAFPTLNSYLSQMNAHIWNSAWCPVADVHSAFNGASGTDDPYAKGYLLTDGYHPNWLGHVVIYGQVRALGYSGVVPTVQRVGGVADQPNLPASAIGQHRPSYTGALALVVVAAASVAMVALGASVDPRRFSASPADTHHPRRDVA